MEKTPDQWWVDYAIAHPDYDPFSLDEAEGTRLYGNAFGHSKQDWAITKAEETAIPEEELRFSHLFLRSHFGESYKHVLLLERFGSRLEKHRTEDSLLKKYLGHYDVHDPVVEKPDAYLHFCRLSHLVELGWTVKRVMTEVLKFVHTYGPPWYPQYAKLFSRENDLTE